MCGVCAWEPSSTDSHSVPHNVTLFTSNNGGGKCDCRRLSVCLSVCLLARLLKNVDGFGWNVACWQMSGHRRTDYLLSPIRIIVQTPEPDYFLRYCCTATRGILLRQENPTYRYWAWLLSAPRSSNAWFWGVERPLSEVNALYRVPF